MRILLTALFLAILSPLLTAQGLKNLYTRTESNNYVTGEVGYVSYFFVDRDLDTEFPEIQVKGLNIQLARHYPTRINGHKIYVYEFKYVGVNPGEYTIPALSFNYYGQTIKSDAVDIKVVDRDLLHKSSQEVYKRQYTFYSYLFSKKKTLYPGETMELEYKVYLPNYSRVLQWGIPSPEKLDNCTAWRFEPPESGTSAGYARIDGQEFIVANYRTVLTALNPGTATIGKLESRIVSAFTVTDPRRGPNNVRVDLLPTHPATSFEVRQFPETPPKDFEGAVGNFQMATTINAKDKIKESESISTSIYVSGEGNLPNLTPPRMLDSKHWELIDSSRTQQGEERKKLKGTIEFKFIIKPKTTASATPRFGLTYFNPDTETFNTLISTNQPIEVEGVSGISAIEGTSAENPEVPEETMRDILGPIQDPESDGRALVAMIPSWSIHVIPGALLLWLLCTTAVRSFRQYQFNNAERRIRLDALSKIENSKSDFLKNAGAYIERWYPHKRSEELQQILLERDQTCYLPAEKSGVSQARRKEILSILKKLALFAVFLAVTAPTSLRASEAAYKAWTAKDYSKALELYQQELAKSPKSADLEYNVANCYYRLDQPGEAALHYYRALELDPYHIEARKNLGFVQSHQASILPSDLADNTKWIAWLNPQSYKDIAFLAGWGILLSTLTLFIKKPRGWSLGGLITIQVLSPIILTAALILYYHHPLRKPTSETTAGVVIQSVPLFTEPFEPLPDELSAKTLIQATPASPCRIIARRNDWTYIELGDFTRGWLPSDKVEAIKPTS
ncbi:hypothetical protein Rhal01_03559 [Rubritalea halochordaticola]|uniref:Tetratricopeptide repeat protein n=1 Tax=Rubritalea halochordaticola TaxID=714537 RepID=A0ABP9V5P6_9BACT